MSATTDEFNKRQRMRALLTCVHFTGLPLIERMSPTCKAGVKYDSVKVVRPGTPHAWPCLPGIAGAAGECAKRVFPTPEQVEEHFRQIDESVARFVSKLREGKVCPHCDVALTKTVRIGRCLYAEPCGHRIGQVGDEEDCDG